MTIIDFGNGIRKNTNITDDHKICITHMGEGCDTIWFKTVAAAREALKENGIKTGKDLFNCSECACYYSISDEKSKKYPLHACGETKKAYARQFEK